MSNNSLPEVGHDERALLKLDQAHKAYQDAWKLHDDELHAAKAEIAQKHNYFILTAQSVLYEAMANAAREGFTNAEMNQVMHGGRLV